MGKNIKMNPKMKNHLLNAGFAFLFFIGFIVLNNVFESVAPLGRVIISAAYFIFLLFLLKKLEAKPIPSLVNIHGRPLANQYLVPPISKTRFIKTIVFCLILLPIGLINALSNYNEFGWTHALQHFLIFGIGGLLFIAWDLYSFYSRANNKYPERLRLSEVGIIGFYKNSPSVFIRWKNLSGIIRSIVRKEIQVIDVMGKIIIIPGYTIGFKELSNRISNEIHKSRKKIKKSRPINWKI